MHVTGTTTNTTDMTDEDFGIVAHDSYRLKRKVEMYQWREICKKKDDDETEYRYELCWSEEPINSNDFHELLGHQNPQKEWPYRSKTYTAEDVKLGKFRLNSD